MPKSWLWEEKAADVSREERLRTKSSPCQSCMPHHCLSGRWWWTRAGSHYQEKGQRRDKLHEPRANRGFLCKDKWFERILRKEAVMSRERGRQIWRKKTEKRWGGMEAFLQFEVENTVDDDYRKCFRGYAEIRQGWKRNKSNSLCCQILRRCFVSLITQFLQPKGMS